MILVFGVAGSGKSTQSQLLVDKTGRTWISMGQLFRDKMAKEMAEYIKTGKLVSDEVTMGLLEQELKEQLPDHKIILDGFPRRVGQAKWLIKNLPLLGDSIEAAVHLVAKEQTVKDRMIARGRSDDSVQAITKRFEEFRNEVEPTLKYIADQDIPVLEIDGEQLPEEINKHIYNTLVNIGVKP